MNESMNERATTKYIKAEQEDFTPRSMISFTQKITNDGEKPTK